MVEGPQMSERERIMGRIREALRSPAALPGHHGGSAPAFPGPDRQAFSQWLPLVGKKKEAVVAAFAKASAELKTDFRTPKDQRTLIDELKKIAAAEGWKKVASHRGKETEAVCKKLGLPVLWTDGGYDVHELEKCDAGITACDALVAQTGTVLLTSRSAGGRALSVLPEHHVVLSDASQMLRDLPAAFKLLKKKYDGDYPSAINLITGPSRTGDIERILVLGAHGPKRLTVFCEGA